MDNEPPCSGKRTMGNWWQKAPAAAEVADTVGRRHRNLAVLLELVRLFEEGKIFEEDARWYLTHALRRHSELVPSDRWQRCRYRSQATIDSDSKSFEYEHVLQNSNLSTFILNQPARWLNRVDDLIALLSLQVTCLVTPEEHKMLKASLFGWERYTKAGILVVDCSTDMFTPADLHALQSQIVQRLKALGISL